MDWIILDRIILDWIIRDWIIRDWIGLDWIGLDWIGDERDILRWNDRRRERGWMAEDGAEAEGRADPDWAV